MFRFLYLWIVVILLTIIFGIYGVVLAVAAPGILAKHIYRPWAGSILFFTGVKVEVEGFDNIPNDPCIFMYNHQSVFDVFAFMSILPVEWKAIMKKKVGRMPFIGWICILSGHYLVSRDRSARDATKIRKIVRKIKNGPSVVVAPEGTRSPDGKLLPFHEGGFLIAMMAQVPVVTMVIQGGLKIRSRISKAFVPGTMRITFFPPIDVKQLPKGKEGREELMRIVRSQMEGVLNKNES